MSHFWRLLKQLFTFKHQNIKENWDKVSLKPWTGCKNASLSKTVLIHIYSSAKTPETELET